MTQSPRKTQPLKRDPRSGRCGSEVDFGLRSKHFLAGSQPPRPRAKHVSWLQVCKWAHSVYKSLASSGKDPKYPNSFKALFYIWARALEPLPNSLSLRQSFGLPFGNPNQRHPHFGPYEP